MSKINRRDFLKLSMALPAAVAVSRIAPSLLTAQENQSGRLPNVIVIVLDTMSAKNLSLYGYQRKTTPNFERFAQRASVYHAHHSGGNFTVPGTASILTGMYPWTHRAINHSGFIARELTQRNFFRAVGKPYTKIAFSQNLWAMHLLAQFTDDIDRLLPLTSFSSTSQIIGEKFTGDLEAALLSMDEFLFWDENPPASLIFGIPERAVLAYRSIHSEDNNTDYPAGLPGTTLLPVYFRLEELFDGILSTIRSLTSPFLAYIHLWGVHLPYRPHQRFYNVFLTGWHPKEKPRHILGGKNSFQVQLKKLRRYDEYIASIDFEFGRLIDQLEQDGTIDSSYVFLTADHGESFERGTQGHTTPLLFEPLIHIPLMVSAPGQTERVDVYAPTNSVDLLPTLTSITGQAIPDWSEGQPLPGLGGSADTQRVSFTIETKSTPSLGAMVKASVAMRQDKYKLVYYKGVDYNFFELYDIERDPEELENLYEQLPVVAKVMQEELLYRFNLANRPYQG
jgi:hypothetical protein